MVRMNLQSTTIVARGDFDIPIVDDLYNTAPTEVSRENQKNERNTHYT